MKSMTLSRLLADSRTNLPVSLLRMTFPTSILLLVALLAIAGETACGGSSSSPGGGSATATIKLTVAFGTTPPPPTTMTAGSQAPLYANITGDTTNSGVTWSCTPGNSATTCGSFTYTNTVTTTYTAPSNPGKVTIIVTSNADTAVSASVPVTITMPSPTVTFVTPPPPTMFTGTTANLVAQITGDPTNAGIKWSCSPATTCGSFTVTVQSGRFATYNAPATVPAAPGVVTITASSASFPTASVSTTVTIVQVLNGHYIFSLLGSNKNPSDPSTPRPYSVAGGFYVTAGAIFSGEQDSYDTGVTTPDLINPVGSSFSLTADGHLQITLVTCAGSTCNNGSTDPFVGVNGIETLNAYFLPLNPNKAFLTEFDSSVAASGTLDWRDPTVSVATPSRGYIFDLNGLSTLTIAPGPGPFSMAGVINVDGVASNGSGTISGTGSIFDACINGSGDEYLSQTLAPNVSTVSSPDSFGRVTFSLAANGPALNDMFPEPIYLAGYIVNVNLIRLVEIYDPFVGISGGTAYAQGTNTGTFTSSNLSGNSYVVGLNGFDLANSTEGPAQLAGVFVFNPTSTATGTVSGFANYNDLSAVQSPAAITDAVYTVDPPSQTGPPDSGTGRVSITGTSTAFNVGTNTIDWLELYLDGNGHAVATVLNGSGNAIGGLGFLQGAGPFATSSLSGAYAGDATGWDHRAIGELDAVGPVTATASSATFSGEVDLNWLFSTGPTFTDLPLAGTLSTANGAAANGVFTGTVTGLDVTTSSNSDAFSFYLIDAAGDSIAIENDVNQLTLLYLFQQ
jgi:hypothetical protein